MCAFFPVPCLSRLRSMPSYVRRAAALASSLKTDVPGTCSRCVSSKIPRPMISLVAETSACPRRKTWGEVENREADVERPAGSLSHIRSRDYIAPQTSGVRGMKVIGVE